MGKELATRGVLVNAITPTVTETALMRPVTPEMNVDERGLPVQDPDGSIL
jgi:NAD(P)-dependent dehydrogenase (short-subunit alcohol dehydrogenase family)